MKAIFTLILLFILHFIASAQMNIDDQKMVSMNDTYQKSYKLGSVYYIIGANTPYTGILYGTYENGNYQTMQTYVDGVGNGKWVDYSPEGIKECEGTYKDNRVEGPVTFFYENGAVKSEGQYIHSKQPIGTWKYYDLKGKLVHTMRYTN